MIVGWAIIAALANEVLGILFGAASLPYLYMSVLVVISILFGRIECIAEDSADCEGDSGYSITLASQLILAKALS